MTNVLNPFDVIFEKLSSLETALLRGNITDEISKPVYLKIDKAADFLSTSENALRVMVHKNQIPHIKKHGKLFFLQSDLIDWFESGRVESVELNPEDLLISSNKKPLQS